MPASHDIKGIIRHVAEISIEELKLEGIAAPDEVPTVYPVASYLIKTGGILEVVEEKHPRRLGDRRDVLGYALADALCLPASPSRQS